jgi:hypothetical protein
MGNDVDSFQEAPGSPGWQQTQNSEYLDLVQHRLRHVSLTWVSQFIGLIEEYSDLKKDISIKDIGCQAFQFYKQMKQKGLPWKYSGYEMEEAYVNILSRQSARRGQNSRCNTVRKSLRMCSLKSIVVK